MSRKSNRLKNRLRIEEERRSSVDRRVALLSAAELMLQGQCEDFAKTLQRHNLAARRLKEEAEKLERSVALRIKVERDFNRADGEIWVIDIRLHPQEFKLAAVGDARRNIGQGIVPVNASRWAQMQGREAGQRIAEVIERVIVDGPQQWEGL